MSSESEDFESADEDLNVSDIGEDELEELLADVPDTESSDAQLNIRDRISEKDTSCTIDTTSKQKRDEAAVIDNVLDNQSVNTTETNGMTTSTLIKNHETVSKTDIDESHDQSLNNLIKVETSGEATNITTSEKSVIATNTNDETCNAHAASETIKIENVPAACDNNVVDDNSNGWDFEDDDIVLPESPEKKWNSLVEKKIENKEDPSMKLKNDNSGWPGWSSWGVSNLISSASEGVSNLSLTMTTGLTSGFTSMLETTLGAPDPQELAKQLATANELQEEPLVQEPLRTGMGSSDLFGFGNLIGGVSNLGSKVITGGLDTLETLGKKTMEVLQEGDPGFKKKRALLFHGEKVILSQVLRDAKEKAEATEQEKEHDKMFRKAQYETLFDDFHGLVHLEALEMISKQCEVKLSSLSSSSANCDDLIDFNEISNKVKCLFEQQHFCDENDKPVENNVNLEEKLNSAIDLLELNINTKNLIEIDAAIDSRLFQALLDPSDIHVKAISDLAQFTAFSIELFHRIAELLIVKENSNFEDDFQALVRVTSVTRSKIGSISERYSAKIMALSDKTLSPLITNIFLEASNSGTYLESAFELFLPILQLKALSYFSSN